MAGEDFVVRIRPEIDRSDLRRFDSEMNAMMNRSAASGGASANVSVPQLPAQAQPSALPNTGAMQALVQQQARLAALQQQQMQVQSRLLSQQGPSLEKFQQEALTRLKSQIQNFDILPKGKQADIAKTFTQAFERKVQEFVRVLENIRPQNLTSKFSQAANAELSSLGIQGKTTTTTPAIAASGIDPRLKSLNERNIRSAEYTIRATEQHARTMSAANDRSLQEQRRASDRLMAAREREIRAAENAARNAEQREAESRRVSPIRQQPVQPIQAVQPVRPPVVQAPIVQPVQPVQPVRPAPVAQPRPVTQPVTQPAPVVQPVQSNANAANAQAQANRAAQLESYRLTRVAQTEATRAAQAQAARDQDARRAQQAADDATRRQQAEASARARNVAPVAPVQPRAIPIIPVPLPVQQPQVIQPVQQVQQPQAQRPPIVQPPIIQRPPVQQPPQARPQPVQPVQWGESARVQSQILAAQAQLDAQSQAQASQARATLEQQMQAQTRDQQSRLRDIQRQLAQPQQVQQVQRPQQQPQPQPQPPRPSNVIPFPTAPRVSAPVARGPFGIPQLRNQTGAIDLGAIVKPKQPTMQEILMDHLASVGVTAYPTQFDTAYTYKDTARPPGEYLGSGMHTQATRLDLSSSTAMSASQRKRYGDQFVYRTPTGAAGSSSGQWDSRTAALRKASKLGLGSRVEQLAAVLPGNVPVTRFVPGESVRSRIAPRSPIGPLDVEGPDVNIPEAHYKQLEETYSRLLEAGVGGDLHPGNLMYSPEAGFTAIDLALSNGSTSRRADRFAKAGGPTNLQGNSPQQMVDEIRLDVANANKVRQDKRKAERLSAAQTRERRRQGAAQDAAIAARQRTGAAEAITGGVVQGNGPYAEAEALGIDVGPYAEAGTDVQKPVLNDDYIAAATRSRERAAAARAAEAAAGGVVQARAARLAGNDPVMAPFQPPESILDRIKALAWRAEENSVRLAKEARERLSQRNQTGAISFGREDPRTAKTVKGRKARRKKSWIGQPGGLPGTLPGLYYPGNAPASGYNVPKLNPDVQALGVDRQDTLVPPEVTLEDILIKHLEESGITPSGRPATFKSTDVPSGGIPLGQGANVRATMIQPDMSVSDRRKYGGDQFVYRTPVGKDVPDWTQRTAALRKAGTLGLGSSVEQLAAVLPGNVPVTKFVPGKNVGKTIRAESRDRRLLAGKDPLQVPEEHYKKLQETFERLIKGGVGGDLGPHNLMYDPKAGFTAIDFMKSARGAVPISAAGALVEATRNAMAGKPAGGYLPGQGKPLSDWALPPASPVGNTERRLERMARRAKERLGQRNQTGAIQLPNWGEDQKAIEANNAQVQAAIANQDMPPMADDRQPLSESLWGKLTSGNWRPGSEIPLTSYDQIGGVLGSQPPDKFVQVKAYRERLAKERIRIMAERAKGPNEESRIGAGIRSAIGPRMGIEGLSQFDTPQQGYDPSRVSQIGSGLHSAAYRVNLGKSPEDNYVYRRRLWNQSSGQPGNEWSSAIQRTAILLRSRELGLEHVEKLATVLPGPKGMVDSPIPITEMAKGYNLNTIASSGMAAEPTKRQWRELEKTYRKLYQAGLAGDLHPGNMMYDQRAGFTAIDLSPSEPKNLYNARQAASDRIQETKGFLTGTGIGYPGASGGAGRLNPSVGRRFPSDGRFDASGRASIPKGFGSEVPGAVGDFPSAEQLKHTRAWNTGSGNAQDYIRSLPTRPKPGVMQIWRDRPDLAPAYKVGVSLSQSSQRIKDKKDEIARLLGLAGGGEDHPLSPSSGAEQTAIRDYMAGQMRGQAPSANEADGGDTPPPLPLDFGSLPGMPDISRGAFEKERRLQPGGDYLLEADKRRRTKYRSIDYLNPGLQKRLKPLMARAASARLALTSPAIGTSSELEKRLSRTRRKMTGGVSPLVGFEDSKQTDLYRMLKIIGQANPEVMSNISEISTTRYGNTATPEFPNGMSRYVVPGETVSDVGIPVKDSAGYAVAGPPSLSLRSFDTDPRGGLIRLSAKKGMGKSPESVLAHEFGHFLDHGALTASDAIGDTPAGKTRFFSGYQDAQHDILKRYTEDAVSKDPIMRDYMSPKQQVQSTIRSNISSYASTNASELMAEATAKTLVGTTGNADRTSLFDDPKNGGLATELYQLAASQAASSRSPSGIITPGPVPSLDEIAKLRRRLTKSNLQTSGMQFAPLAKRSDQPTTQASFELSSTIRDLFALTPASNLGQNPSQSPWAGYYPPSVKNLYTPRNVPITPISPNAPSASESGSMTSDEITAAMQKHAELSAMLPTPTNADQSRDARKMLGSLPGNQAADQLVAMYPDHPASKQYKKGLITPDDLHFALLSSGQLPSASESAPDGGAVRGEFILGGKAPSETRTKAQQAARDKLLNSEKKPVARAENARPESPEAEEYNAGARAAAAERMLKSQSPQMRKRLKPLLARSAGARLVNNSPAMGIRSNLWKLFSRTASSATEPPKVSDRFRTPDPSIDNPLMGLIPTKGVRYPTRFDGDPFKMQADLYRSMRLLGQAHPETMSRVGEISTFAYGGKGYGDYRNEPRLSNSGGYANFGPPDRGYWNPRSQGLIRLANNEDDDGIRAKPTLAHEFGHQIDKKALNLSVDPKNYGAVTPYQKAQAEILKRYTEDSISQDPIMRQYMSPKQQVQSTIRANMGSYASVNSAELMAEAASLAISGKTASSNGLFGKPGSGGMATELYQLMSSYAASTRKDETSKIKPGAVPSLTSIDKLRRRFMGDLPAPALAELPQVSDMKFAPKAPESQKLPTAESRALSAAVKDLFAVQEGSYAPWPVNNDYTPVNTLYADTDFLKKDGKTPTSLPSMMGGASKPTLTQRIAASARARLSGLGDLFKNRMGQRGQRGSIDVAGMIGDVTSNQTFGSPDDVAWKKFYEDPTAPGTQISQAYLGKGKDAPLLDAARIQRTKDAAGKFAYTVKGPGIADQEFTGRAPLARAKAYALNQGGLANQATSAKFTQAGEQFDPTGQGQPDRYASEQFGGAAGATKILDLLGGPAGEDVLNAAGIRRAVGKFIEAMESLAELEMRQLPVLKAGFEAQAAALREYNMQLSAVAQATANSNLATDPTFLENTASAKLSKATLNNNVSELIASDPTMSAGQTADDARKQQLQAERNRLKWLAVEAVGGDVPKKYQTITPLESATRSMTQVNKDIAGVKLISDPKEALSVLALISKEIRDLKVEAADLKVGMNDTQARVALAKLRQDVSKGITAVIETKYEITGKPDLQNGVPVAPSYTGTPQRLNELGSGLVDAQNAAQQIITSPISDTTKSELSNLSRVLRELKIAAAAITIDPLDQSGMSRLDAIKAGISDVAGTVIESSRALATPGSRASGSSGGGPKFNPSDVTSSSYTPRGDPRLAESGGVYDFAKGKLVENFEGKPGDGGGGGGKGKKGIPGQPGPLGFFAQGAMSTIKYGLPSMALYGGVSVFKNSMKEAEGFEYNLKKIDSQIKDTFGPNSEGITNAFAKTIMNTSVATGVATDDMAELGVQILGAFKTEKIDFGNGQMLSGIKSASKQVEAAGKIALVTGLPLKEVTDGMTAASLAFGVSYEKLGNIAVKLEAKTGVHARETISFLGDIAPAAVEAGFSPEKIAAMAAVTSQRSGRPEAALAESFGRVLPMISQNKRGLLQLAAGSQAFDEQFVKDVTSNNTEGALFGIGRAFEAKGPDGKPALDRGTRQQLVQILGGAREAQNIIPMLTNSKQVAGLANDAKSSDGQLEGRFVALQGTLTNTFSRITEQLRVLFIEMINGGVGDFIKSIAGGAQALLAVSSGVFHIWNKFNTLMGGFPAKLVAILALMKGVQLASATTAVSTGATTLAQKLGAGFLGTQVGEEGAIVGLASANATRQALISGEQASQVVSLGAINTLSKTRIALGLGAGGVSGIPLFPTLAAPFRMAGGAAANAGSGLMGALGLGAGQWGRTLTEGKYAGYTSRMGFNTPPMPAYYGAGGPGALSAGKALQLAGTTIPMPVVAALGVGAFVGGKWFRERQQKNYDENMLDVKRGWDYRGVMPGTKKGDSAAGAASMTLMNLMTGSRKDATDRQTELAMLKLAESEGTNGVTSRNNGPISWLGARILGKQTVQEAFNARVAALNEEQANISTTAMDSLRGKERKQYNTAVGKLSQKQLKNILVGSESTTFKNDKTRATGSIYKDQASGQSYTYNELLKEFTPTNAEEAAAWGPIKLDSERGKQIAGNSRLTLNDNQKADRKYIQELTTRQDGSAKKFDQKQLLEDLNQTEDKKKAESAARVLNSMDINRAEILTGKGGKNLDKTMQERLAAAGEQTASMTELGKYSMNIESAQKSYESGGMSGGEYLSRNRQYILMTENLINDQIKSGNRVAQDLKDILAERRQAQNDAAAKLYDGQLAAASSLKGITEFTTVGKKVPDQLMTAMKDKNLSATKQRDYAIQYLQDQQSSLAERYAVAGAAGGRDAIASDTSATLTKDQIQPVRDAFFKAGIEDLNVGGWDSINNQLSKDAKKHPRIANVLGTTAEEFMAKAQAAKDAGGQQAADFNAGLQSNIDLLKARQTEIWKAPESIVNKDTILTGARAAYDESQKGIPVKDQKAWDELTNEEKAAKIAEQKKAMEEQIATAAANGSTVPNAIYSSSQLTELGALQSDIDTYTAVLQQSGLDIGGSLKLAATAVFKAAEEAQANLDKSNVSQNANQRAWIDMDTAKQVLDKALADGNVANDAQAQADYNARVTEYQNSQLADTVSGNTSASVYAQNFGKASTSTRADYITAVQKQQDAQNRPGGVGEAEANANRDAVVAGRGAIMRADTAESQMGYDLQIASNRGFLGARNTDSLTRTRILEQKAADRVARAPEGSDEAGAAIIAWWDAQWETQVEVNNAVTRGLHLAQVREIDPLKNSEAAIKVAERNMAFATITQDSAGIDAATEELIMTERQKQTNITNERMAKYSQQIDAYTGDSVKQAIEAESQSLYSMNRIQEAGYSQTSAEFVGAQTDYAAKQRATFNAKTNREVSLKQKELSKVSNNAVKSTAGELDIASYILAQAVIANDLDGQIAAQTRVNSAQIASRNAIGDARSAMLELRGAELSAMEDEVGVAQVNAQNQREAVQRAVAAQAGTAEVSRLRAQSIAADKQLANTIFQNRKDDIQWQFDMEKITRTQYIQYLEGLKSALIPGTKQFKSLELEIKRLKDDISGNLQMNIPTAIKLPTLYEVRRLDQSTGGAGVQTGARGGYQDNRNIQVVVNVNNGMSPTEIINTISKATGNGTTGYDPTRY